MEKVNGIARKRAQMKVRRTATEDNKLPAPLRLDLGCGENCQVHTDGQKFFGVDLFEVPGVDMKHDLTVFPYPFEDNSVDEVFCSHFLEHLDGLQRISFFNEMHRILKPGAKMRLVHPYYKSPRAIQDPTHKWPPICEESYFYWQKGFREFNKLQHYTGISKEMNFRVNIWYTWQDGEASPWPNKNEELRNFAMKHYWNVIGDMIADLVKE